MTASSDFLAGVFLGRRADVEAPVGEESVGCQLCEPRNDNSCQGPCTVFLLRLDFFFAEVLDFTVAGLASGAGSDDGLVKKLARKSNLSTGA